MTDTHSNSTPAIDTDIRDAEARMLSYLHESIRSANRDALFDALARAGITDVIVDFDGSGDSGQIENIQAKASDVLVELPAGVIDILRIMPDGVQTERVTIDIRELIDQLAYDLLADNYGGWGNDDGAYGHFAFNVQKRSIELHYHARYTSSHYYFDEL
jgi:hypothetical protein